MSDSVVGAFLSARVFGRISLLGAEPTQMLDQGFLLGYPRQHYELARAIRGFGSQSGFSADLAQQIRLVLDEHQYDPLRLVRLGASADANQVSFCYPSEIFRNNPPKAASVGRVRLDVADAHLHSGASIDPASFVDLLVRSQSPTPLGLRDLVAVDSNGEIFAIGFVAAALRQHLAWELARRCRIDIDLHDEQLKALNDSSYWKEVGKAAVAVLNKTDPSTQQKWESITCLNIDLGSHVDVPGAVRDLLKDAIAGTEPKRRLCRGMVGALFLINQFLKSAPGEGLPSFVDRFDQMGLLRDYTLRKVRGRVVGASVQGVFSPANVVAAEFRKSIYVAPEGTAADARDKIRESLADHLAGFSIGGPSSTPRRYSMPVTFLRTADRPQKKGNEAPTLLHSIAPIWRLGSAIETFLQEFPLARRYITAVDVVGDELAMPNWVFSPVLTYLREQRDLDLQISCHAGEAFLWHLHGVRCVGELLLPDRIVDRIGHALSLDSQVADFVTGWGRSEFDRRTVVEDLCWLIANSIYEVEATELLELVLTECGFDNLGLTVQNFMSAWFDRRSVDSFVRYGLAGGLHDPPADYLDLETSRSARGDFLAFLILTHTGNYPYDALDRRLEKGLATMFKKFDHKAAIGATEILLSALATTQVVIESCPTSNMRLAGLPRVKYLPLKTWTDRDIAVSLNSDDPLIFGTSINAEFELVKSEYNDKELLRKLASVSVSSCCPTSTPALPSELNRDLVDLEGP